ncbi:oxalate decarboxylase/phosphoglucose isomerase-like protein (cupin superfamily) [Amycolatopsis bartoniae]|uniref:Cupin type-1 domain-containing protein n=1 Tax=Amycolatopsis bartoniae TaxID=941986 RepID=A0A8H9MBQ1_9PSEU|nr:cupin domain-containing protein [Amycolatopsis bartoniae]MBB2940206.1 oxalate decarboxylase/phosphoglucose isomerase-like protein (cupin superfamily) [Amycolatopsis bartoniae]GHF66405.1 hypothetical protein GCM10017566_45240 [Amycolatopsis bartoniae]
MDARIITVPSEPISDPQPRKLGLWSTERLQVSAWRLRQGQQIVAHMHPKADGMIVVLRGDGELFVFDTEEPNPDVCYMPAPERGVTPPPQAPLGEATRHSVGSGIVGLVPAGTFYGLVNTGPGPLVAVAATAPDPSATIWTTRPQ